MAAAFLLTSTDAASGPFCEREIADGVAVLQCDLEFHRFTGYCSGIDRFSGALAILTLRPGRHALVSPGLVEFAFGIQQRNSVDLAVSTRKYDLDGLF